MNKILPAILGALALVALVWLAFRSQATLEANLPAKREFAQLKDAYLDAYAAKLATGGNMVAILGTGSMAPYIPAAPKGTDPLAVTVGFAVTDPTATFASVKVGDVLLYRPASKPDSVWMHVVAAIDSRGLIMSGLNNEVSESWMRVTAANYVGKVAFVFVHKP